MRDRAFVALGSNLGDRAAFLAAARAGIAALPRTRVLATSLEEETAPIGPPGQDNYLNQMVALETELTPRELLRELQRIERECGRVRDVHWGPRTLDLDIVQFDGQAVHEDDLVVPHPALQERVFWQRELDDLRHTLSVP